jgi:hypothetical protein
LSASAGQGRNKNDSTKNKEVNLLLRCAAHDIASPGNESSTLVEKQHGAAALPHR